MTNFSILFLSVEKAGGLFDIDATLPVLMAQFFILVQVLKFVLFNPIQNFLKQREVQIEENLRNAKVSLDDVEKVDQQVRRLVKALRERDSWRLNLVEKKTQDSLLQTKKYLELKTQEAQGSGIEDYRKTLLKASFLLSTIKNDLNSYLRLRPPIHRF